MCNARSQCSNIQFCQVPYLEIQRNDTRNNIFGFAVSHLNSDLNAPLDYLQKLKENYPLRVAK